ATPAHPAQGVRFELNQGQTDRAAGFVVRGAGYPMFLAGPDAVMVMAKAPATDAGAAAGSGSRSTARGGTAPTRVTVTGPVVRLPTAGGNPAAQVTGVDRLPGVSNYLVGSDRSRWRTGVPAYAGVRVHDVYPGVDLVYHAGAGGGVEYDYELAPGASADA